jgi:hypothetical protein
MKSVFSFLSQHNVKPLLLFLPFSHHVRFLFSYLLLVSTTSLGYCLCQSHLVIAQWLHGILDSSFENYLGGEPWTRPVGFAWVPWILQSVQTPNSHNIFSTNLIVLNRPIINFVLTYMSNNIS